MNSYLETAIAVILVIVIFSVIAYVIQELIAANLEYRGKMLKSSLQALLDGQKTVSVIVDKIYAHPQIQKLKAATDKLPSYVPSANFALALIDEVAKSSGANTGKLYDDFKNGISKFSAAGGDLNILLTNYLNTSADLKELQANIEKWFNEYMDRVTGWYKKNTVLTLRIVAVIVALSFNVDLINITKTINSNDTLKASLVNTADRLADQPDYIKKIYQDNINTKISAIDEAHKSELATAKDSGKLIIQINNKITSEKDSVLKNYTKTRIGDINTLLKTFDNTELPVGWNKENWKAIKTGSDWLMKIIGWFLAAMAISMGAPFWFELLIKLVNIRRAGVKPKDKDK